MNESFLGTDVNSLICNCNMDQLMIKSDDTDRMILLRSDNTLVKNVHNFVHTNMHYYSCKGVNPDRKLLNIRPILNYNSRSDMCQKLCIWTQNESLLKWEMKKKCKIKYNNVIKNDASWLSINKAKIYAGDASVASQKCKNIMLNNSNTCTKFQSCCCPNKRYGIHELAKHNSNIIQKYKYIRLSIPNSGNKPQPLNCFCPNKTSGGNIFNLSPQ